MAKKKAAKPAAMTDQLREFIAADGRSIRAIATAIELDHANLGRFVKGERSLSQESLDKLFAGLRLDVVQRPAE